MDMPPVHMCVFLTYEHKQLKEKIIQLKDYISQLETTIADKRTCSISCQTRLSSLPVKVNIENEERLRRLIDDQNQLLERYQQESIEKRQSSLLIDEFEHRLVRCRKEKEQAEQRANFAQKRLKKFEEKYEQMKQKMNIFDDGFFEEVNHLKLSLQQATHLSREYEKTIEMLSSQLGIKYPVNNQ